MIIPIATQLQSQGLLHKKGTANCAIFEDGISINLNQNHFILERLFDTNRQNRKILAQILRQTPREQLTRIPQGFNNNIWWNIAHVVVTHQILLYALSKLPMATEEGMVSRYRKGTYPQGIPAEEDIKEIEALLLSTADKAEKDYTDDIFVEYTPYTTSLGVSLNCFEDALAFNTFHEGLHLGVIMSIKKLLA